MKSAEHKPILIHRIPMLEYGEIIYSYSKEVKAQMKDYHHFFVSEYIENLKLEVLRVEDAKNISVEELTKLVESTYKEVTNE